MAAAPARIEGHPRAPILLAGPTAAGKSDVAMMLAEKIDGEIISVDSMQVYRGLDVGTAKPSVAARARIAHHLIDVIGLDQHFDAAQFCAQAARAVREIQQRGRVPIFCGGTGLYFRAYLDGLGEAPGTHSALRSELEQIPLPQLLEELQQGDPELFATIDRNNARRVVRAVEVIRQTGQPFSKLRAAWRDGDKRDTAGLPMFVLTRSVESLRGRIERRVEEMFVGGLVAETERLLPLGLESNRTAMQALGYRQVVEYLQGVRSLPATIELVKIRTRQFAKRQLTWFRRQIGVQWRDLDAAGAESRLIDDCAELAERGIYPA